MTYVRPNIYINKQTSPIFNCVIPVSVSLSRQIKRKNLILQDMFFSVICFVVVSLPIHLYSNNFRILENTNTNCEDSYVMIICDD